MKNEIAASRVLTLVGVLKKPPLLKSQLAERIITLENPCRLSERRGTGEHDLYCDGSFQFHLLEYIYPPTVMSCMAGRVSTLHYLSYPCRLCGVKKSPACTQLKPRLSES
jgi:hypothetical protein